jgi:hypothetical protein
MLFNQLYLKVNTWVSEFTVYSGLPSALPPVIENLVIYSDVNPILHDKILHRRLLKGALGHAISYMMHPEFETQGA